MKDIVKLFKIVILMCTFVLPCLNSHNAMGEKNNGNTSTVDVLEKYLRTKGFETKHLFLHPNFRIYENIDSLFEKSAEKKGKTRYEIALKKGDMEEAERVFIEEYNVYKRKIGFDNKKKMLSRFIEEHSIQLSLAETTYHIPKEVIAAIIGLESDFGRVTGRYNPFNVYVSMYVKNYRKKFALAQLEELLQFTHKMKQDIFELKSSYAGAIGYMQFIPYSLNRWFVGDNIFDMDASISSVANYLSHFKKQRNLEKAVFSYNPSKYYVKTVLELADYTK